MYYSNITSLGELIAALEDFYTENGDICLRSSIYTDLSIDLNLIEYYGTRGLNISVTERQY